MFEINRKLIETIANATPDEIKTGKFPGVIYADSAHMAVAQKNALHVSTGMYHEVFYPENKISVDERILTIYHEIGHYFFDSFKKYLKKHDPLSLKELTTGGKHPFVVSSKMEHGLVSARYIFQQPRDLTSNPKILHDEAIADAFAAYFTSPKTKADFKKRYPEAFSWFDKHVKCMDEFKTPVKGMVINKPSYCRA